MFILEMYVLYLNNCDNAYIWYDKKYIFYCPTKMSSNLSAVIQTLQSITINVYQISCKIIKMIIMLVVFRYQRKGNWKLASCSQLIGSHNLYICLRKIFCKTDFLHERFVSTFVYKIKIYLAGKHIIFFFNHEWFFCLDTFKILIFFRHRLMVQICLGWIGNEANCLCTPKLTSVTIRPFPLAKTSPAEIAE